MSVDLLDHQKKILLHQRLIKPNSPQALSPGMSSSVMWCGGLPVWCEGLPVWWGGLPVLWTGVRGIYTVLPLPSVNTLPIPSRQTGEAYITIMFVSSLPPDPLKLARYVLHRCLPKFTLGT